MNNFSAIKIFNTNIWHLSGPRLIEKGRSLLTLINGNAFYPLSSWLNDIRLKFWKKPISDQDTFQLMLFCLSNGCSSHLITECILTSLHWATTKKEKNEQSKWIISRTTLALNYTFGFILIYTMQNGSFWMDKLGQKQPLTTLILHRTLNTYPFRSYNCQFNIR